MRKLTSVAIISLLIMPLTVMATWQITNPRTNTEQKHLTNSTSGKTDYPPLYAHSKDHVFLLRKGLLQSNIERIANQRGWSVNWQASRRYYLLINTQIAGPNFPIIANCLLRNYPLTAKYNYKYRVMTILPKKKMHRRHKKILKRIIQ